MSHAAEPWYAALATGHRTNAAPLLQCPKAPGSGSAIAGSQPVQIGTQAALRLLTNSGCSLQALHSANGCCVTKPEATTRPAESERSLQVLPDENKDDSGFRYDCLQRVQRLKRMMRQRAGPVLHTCTLKARVASWRAACQMSPPCANSQSSAHAATRVNCSNRHRVSQYLYGTLSARWLLENEEPCAFESFTSCLAGPPQPLDLSVAKSLLSWLTQCCG